MGDKASRDQRSGPAIREVGIDEGGESRSLEAPTPAGRPWIVAAVIAATVAGVAYGFLLGRGDRPGPAISDALGTTTTSSPSATTANPDPFAETLEAFVRASPGHDLGTGVTEFLNSNHYRALAVDREGIIWAGGPSGVVRLDPSTGEFTKLTDTDGTGPLDTVAIATAPDGTVWAASNRGLSHWDGEAWTHDSRFPRSHPENHWVAGLEVGPDGDVWLAANNWSTGFSGTARIHRLHEPFAGDMPTYEVGSDVRAIDMAADGTLWAILGNRLWRHDGAWHEEVRFRTTVHIHITAIDEAGDVWLAGEDRIFRWNGQDLSEVAWGTTTQRDPDVLGYGPGAFVMAMAAGIDDDVWGLTYRWGPPTESGAVELIHYRAGSFESTPLPGEPDPAGPPTLVVAPDGSVWVATETALRRYDGEWQEYSIDAGPPLSSAQSMAVGLAGELWVASTDGIIQTDGTHWVRFGLTDFGLEPADQEAGEYWVTAAPDGSIWGGIGCLAFELIDGEWRALPPPPDAPDQCWNIAARIDPEGALWMSPGCCSALAPVFRWVGEEWATVTTTREFGDLTFADDGAVWMVDGRGINRFAAGEWDTVLAGVYVTEIAASGNGAIWAAAGRRGETGGLWRHDGETWRLTRSGDAIHSLTRAPDGSVWALQTRSDGATDLLDLSTGRIRFVAESATPGTMTISPDGTIWIGGEGRLYRVDPLY